MGCQNSGINLCMDNKGNPATGYAVLNGTYQPGKYIPNSLPVPPPSATTSSTSTVTPVPTPTTRSSSETRTVGTTPTSQPSPSGLGGYAVVHPNGKVCGVIVATSADPFGNGGKMPVEYMGCPVGSRIIFQTTASPTGNVSGWHGEKVTYNGSEFEIKSGTSDTATVQTKIKGGVATDSDGRVWDTGSGAILKPATVTTTTTPETATATVTTTTTPETATATVTTTATPATATVTTTTTPETATVTTTTTPSPTNSSTPQTLAVNVSIPDSVAVDQVLASLGTSDKESQLVARVLSKKKSNVLINTEFANSLLQFIASKKGSKTITLSVLTNANGDANLNVMRSLSGYTISLRAGAKTLDRDKISNT